MAQLKPAAALYTSTVEPFGTLSRGSMFYNTKSSAETLVLGKTRMLGNKTKGARRNRAKEAASDSEGRQEREKSSRKPRDVPYKLNKHEEDISECQWSYSRSPISSYVIGTVVRNMQETKPKLQERPIGERLERAKDGATPLRRVHYTAGARTTTTNDSVDECESAVSTNSKEGHRGGSDDEPYLHERGKGPKPRAFNTGRVNKNRPQEVSSTRAVGRFREVLKSRSTTGRDPRFQSGGGPSKLNYDMFRTAYKFLESYQDTEIEELRGRLKKEKRKDQADQMQALLSRLQQQRAERAHGDRTRNALRQAKNKEREAVASGKKPYFLKGSEKKRLSMEQRYEELKDDGKLARFMDKKRKKNAAKEHRWLPAKRQNHG